ncbi:dolichyl-diphosphooligosaccharide--protein glycosyltransferase subunit 1 [Coemansia erecta]|uniref:Dolichyl-diphosphooligosaccharide--protein glycosyltransferase subunit 1 n=1 Tax=Coemansia erecta TaxID=147472 RepID=A0A9W7Y4S0_9FUNG|nr:dolichyl-diphosphooligosaccharide--protein glycosyltransferase subunit 1 [Coemansia erecta]
MRLHPGHLLALVALLGQQTVVATLVNSNLIRTVTLGASAYVTEQIGVVVQNTDTHATHTSYRVWAGDAAKLERLASLHVHERKSGRELPVTKKDDMEYVVTLGSPLAAGEKIGLSIDMVYTQMAQPAPATNVGQEDDQRWAWDDQLLVASPYATRKQKTVVSLDGNTNSNGGTRLVRHEGARGSRDPDTGSVVFGPFNSGDTAGRGRVVFVSNAEHVEATGLQREYFVSHWDDTLHVSDACDVRNAGPSTPGGAIDGVQRMMSRFTGARDHLIKSFVVHVPGTAREAFFVDAIGNVSTSAIGTVGKRQKAVHVMQLKPRYPLAGGWRYAWRHGYRVPLGEHLRRATDGRFHLHVPFIERLVASSSSDKHLAVPDHSAAAVLDYELRVTLPQGACNVELRAPFEAEYRIEHAKHYLDAPGVARPVVVVSMRNVPPAVMGQNVVVSYDYSWAAMWLKPAAIAACVMGLFVLASVVSRLQFGLAPAASKLKSKAE